MAIESIDVRVDDVTESVHFLSDAYGWAVRAEDANYGELDAGGLIVMLSREAMVPWTQVEGLILHDRVEDVASSVARAVKAGAELLLGPLITDWGTEAAYLRGPGDLIVDLYRHV